MKMKVILIIFLATSFSVAAQTNSNTDSLELVKCKEMVEEKQFYIYTLSQEFKKAQNELLNLRSENEKLRNKIILHNERLKGSQQKFIID